MATLTSRPELHESGRCVHWRAWGPPITWWQRALEAHSCCFLKGFQVYQSPPRITLQPEVQEGYHILSSYVQNISPSRRRRPHLSCLLRMPPGPCQASGHARELFGRLLIVTGQICTRERSDGLTVGVDTQISSPALGLPEQAVFCF